MRASFSSSPQATLLLPLPPHHEINLYYGIRQTHQWTVTSGVSGESQSHTTALIRPEKWQVIPSQHSLLICATEPHSQLWPQLANIIISSLSQLWIGQWAWQPVGRVRLFNKALQGSAELVASCSPLQPHVQYTTGAFSLIRSQGGGGAHFWRVTSPPRLFANRQSTPSCNSNCVFTFKCQPALLPFAQCVFLGVNFIMEFPSSLLSLCSLEVWSHGALQCCLTEGCIWMGWNRNWN